MKDLQARDRAGRTIQQAGDDSALLLAFALAVTLVIIWGAVALFGGPR